ATSSSRCRSTWPTAGWRTPGATGSPSLPWPCPTSWSPCGSSDHPPISSGHRAGDTMDVVLDVVHRTYRSSSLLVLGVIGLAFVAGLAVWVLVDELGRGHWLVSV